MAVVPPVCSLGMDYGCCEDVAMFRSFEEVLSFLDGLGMFHMDFGLDRMYRAIKALRL